MSKKWLLTLAGSLLAAMIVTGCADDQDPAPPEDTNEENPTEDNGGTDTEENMDMNEGAENGDDLLEEGTEEGLENGDILEDDGAENGADEATENGTTDEGNNEGIEEGMTNPEADDKKDE